MRLSVSYPSHRGTLEPHAMTAQQVWGIAEQVRQRLSPHRRIARLDLERLTRPGGSVAVNGITITTHWDLNRRVRDDHGREALGVTEADPETPGAVLISLNAGMIAGRDYLRRSTLAHELGHAIFDGPSMVRLAGQRAFAMVTPDEAHFAQSTRGRDGMNWREFRANEFMGALLVPRPLLHRELVHGAIALRLSLVDAREDLPVLRAGCDRDRVEQLLLDLAERFGVSASFIEYRLRRYDLVH